jgi:hypothetical protein
LGNGEFIEKTTKEADEKINSRFMEPSWGQRSRRTLKKYAGGKR